MIYFTLARKYRYFARLITGSLVISILMIPALATALNGSGHYDDTSWSGLNDISGYSNISVDITPQVWASGNDGYYYSNNAVFTNNTNIYGGLQTNGFDGSRWIGKMAIFSIWDVSSGIAEPSGTGTPFGGEGTGYSVRIPFNWQTGTSYRFNMYIEQDSSSGNRLWAASVTNLSNGSVSRIGRIYAPVNFGKIHNPVTFHERYSANPNNCNEILPSQVSFTNMTANNGSVRSTGWDHYVVKSIPECPGIVWLSEEATGYTSGINTTKPSPTSSQLPTTSSPTTSKPQPTAPSQIKKSVVPSKTQPTVIGTSKVYPVAKNTLQVKEKSSKWSTLTIVIVLLLTIIIVPVFALMTRFVILKYSHRKLRA
jgi:hypothetical protein